MIGRRNTNANKRKENYRNSSFSHYTISESKERERSNTVLNDRNTRQNTSSNEEVRYY